MNSLALMWLVLVAVLCLVVARRSSRTGEPVSWIYYVFFASGCPALIYQIVWERSLFAIYGVNVESVTVVVTGFMLGLGLGSLAGGYLSRIPNMPLLALFGTTELGTALYGAFSLRLFHQVAVYTAGSSLLASAIMSFALLLIPTMLMGATLPLLVEYTVRKSHNVGSSLGMLYFVNTFGSASACFLAAGITMRLLGQSGSVRVAAAISATVGLTVLAMHFRQRAQPALNVSAEPRSAGAGEAPVADLLKLWLAALFVAVAGFIALAYEIVWYRLFSYWSGSNARVFATVLGIYLTGIAVGGLIVHDLTSQSGKKRNTGQYLRLAAGLVVLANLAGFAVAPAMRLAAHYNAALLVVALAAAMLAATFPLVCHVSLAADSQTGSRLSLLYFSNILGSALGSFLVGFVLMNIWGVRDISVFLSLLGVGLGIALLVSSKPSARQLAGGVLAGAVICGGILTFANPLFNGLYEQILSATEYDHREHFSQVVENRSGVFAVTENGTVFGGGVYDGHFNVDLVNDVNSIFRAYVLSGFHPSPQRVLMIGLSSGSWAQVIANHPQLQEMTIVEINPGYLQAIPQYPQVASLLTNPKVKIVIDDGRRWLLANPQRSFDVIVMNTSFNWREHITNLLSVEFLQLARRHLKPGGVLYYNTTGSPEVFLTGATVFPYALRVANFLAVSDDPIALDAARLERVLREYRIDGRPVLNLEKPGDAARLREVLAITARFNSDDGFRHPSVEYADSIRAHCRGSRIITDDNMGTEWMN